MAEAWGTLIVKAPSELLNRIISDSDEVSENEIVTLLHLAGVKKKQIQSAIAYGDDYSLACSDGSCLFKDKLSKEEYASLEIFGDNWMPVAASLASAGNGNKVHMYGIIESEHGGEEFYAISDSVRFYELIDRESGHNWENAEKIKKEWLKCIPKRFHEKFGKLGR